MRTVLMPRPSKKSKQARDKPRLAGGFTKPATPPPELAHDSGEREIDDDWEDDSSDEDEEGLGKRTSVLTPAQSLQAFYEYFLPAHLKTVKLPTVEEKKKTVHERYLSRSVCAHSLVMYDLQRKASALRSVYTGNSRTTTWRHQKQESDHKKKFADHPHIDMFFTVRPVL